MSRTTRLLLVVQILTVLAGLAAIAAIQLRPPSLSASHQLTTDPPVAVAEAGPGPGPRAVTPAPTKAKRVARKADASKAVARHVKPQVKRASARHTHAPRRSAAPTRRTAAVPATRVAAPTGSTPKSRMERAIARIPGYPKGAATWVLESRDGYWGTADWYTNTIYISPKVPAHRIYDVVAHEWSHLKSVMSYGGDVRLAMAGMNEFYGATGIIGAERAADCMARVLGATWTHYTSCSNSTWRSGAAKLLAGKQL